MDRGAMNYSPYHGSTPGREYYYDKEAYASPSPTPSPRAGPFYQQRPATRAHFRHMSGGGFGEWSPRPPQSSPRYTSDGQYATFNAGHAAFDREASYATPRREPEPAATPRRPGTARRASVSVPQQRPQTVRPSSSHKKSTGSQAPAGSTAARKATEADARKHRIPSGYSLKNWDPAEEPIMLLGSVFDANSLGKWIYDWTVYHHGPNTPISDMAGELWLLLIQLAGKIKRSDEVVPKIRSQENKEMVEDFIESGERLTEKLRKLLKMCEAPMLKAQKRKDSQLGKNSGVEFVETLFGRERELDKTERFMQSVRLWNLRFDANCEEVLQQPHV